AAEASIEVDPLDEEAHRALMEALRRGGRPAAALAAYERLRAALAEELGVDPAPETRDLHVSILRGEGPREPVVSPAPRLHPADPGFVGRDPEVAELTERWSDAVAGRPSFVLIIGEAGIGKTRLAGAVAELARA